MILRHVRFFQKTIYLHPTCDEEVTDVIKQLSTKVTTYTDNEFKTLSNEIANKTLNTGEFSDKFKKALLTPMFKSGNKYTIPNYQPISMTSNLAKF